MDVKFLSECPFCKTKLDPEWTYCDNLNCKSKFLQNTMGSGKNKLYKWAFNIGDHCVICQFFPSDTTKINRNVFIQIYAMFGPNFSPIVSLNEPFVPDFSDIKKLEEKINTIVAFS